MPKVTFKMKKEFKKLIQLSIITVIFIGCVRHEPQYLPANHLIDGTYIDIHSPNAEKWSKMIHSDSQIIFGKKGIKYNESYIARVVFFPLKSRKNKNDFFNLIQEQASKSIDKERFIVIKSNFKLSNKRKYPCVIAQQLVQDKKATTSKNNKENLIMQIKALYCKDPKREKAAFMIGYSYRGEAINSNFDLEADSFIDGVRFSKYN